MAIGKRGEAKRYGRRDTGRPEPEGRGKDAGVTLDGFPIRYGKTTVWELLGEGYTISGFEQITQEPALATCNLHKNGATIALLGFYGIKEKIGQEQVLHTPIDLVLPQNGRRGGKARRKNRTLLNKIVWTCLIHLIAAALFCCIFALPPLFAFFQHTRLRHTTVTGAGILIPLVLPALIIAFLWGGDVIGERGAAGKKLLLALWLILNVGVSLGYFILIGIAFS